MACRRERCGSSVYVQKKWSSTAEACGGGILVEVGCDAEVVDGDVFADTRRCGEAVSIADMERKTSVQVYIEGKE